MRASCPEISPQSPHLFVGQQLQFELGMGYVAAEWESSNEDVATIDHNGLATGHAPGTTQISTRPRATLPARSRCTHRTTDPMAIPSTRPNRAALAAAALLSLAAPAAGQAPPPSPGETVRFVHAAEIQRMRGDVMIADTVARRVIGSLSSIGADSIVVESDGRREAALLAAVSELQVQRGREPASIRRGAINGALVGMASLAFLAAMAGSGGNDGDGFGTTGNWVAGGAGAGLVLGAGIGALVNAFREVPAWIDVEIVR